jgi:hypothetical protein
MHRLPQSAGLTKSEAMEIQTKTLPAIGTPDMVLSIGQQSREKLPYSA